MPPPATPVARVLLADDEAAIRQTLGRLLADRGHEVETVPDGAEACERLREGRFDCVIADLKMPRADGLDVLRVARERAPGTAVIIMTGFGTVEAAVEAMHLGARHFIEKPVAADDLDGMVRASVGLGAKGDHRAPARPPGRPGPAPAVHGMVGADAGMLEVFELVTRVAASDATVLIAGESGTGKELVARAIHEASRRRAGLLVPVNCAAIPEGLLESELFGHVKGAFTGAHANRTGRFALADGGTIFLDEIGEMPLPLQAKLLRVLQERTIEPVGASRPAPVDVRVLAATNRDLEAMVAGGSFREDLYYRLSVIPVTLPPLRARRADVGLLLDHFLARFSERSGRRCPVVGEDAAALLLRYDWPGNVRELENLAERLVVLCAADVVGVDDIPAKLHHPRGAGAADGRAGGPPHLPDEGLDLKELLQRTEDALVDAALDRTGGNRNRAAMLLGLNRTTLVEKLRKRGL